MTSKYYAVNGKGGGKSELRPGQLVRFNGPRSGSFAGREARIVHKKPAVVDSRGKGHDVYVVQLGTTGPVDPRSQSLIVTIREHLVPVVKEPDKE